VESAAAAGPGTVVTTFQKTKPISTYVFAFAAGPFRELTAASDAVPYRLLVRQSKLRRAEQEWPDVLRITNGGLQHLSKFFDYPFPFPKYDQVLIPGLAYGGMEHAGATFLREEGVLFRTTPNATDLARRNQLLLHELTHQWFGDLVTMRWFDDLWLKEGFATYMGYHAEAAMEPADAVWKRFYESTKPAAYAIDATPGTTPIHQDLTNLIDAKSAYGAIVYSKAPGLLRYLSYTIGETAFRDGLRTYLKRHEYANATWDDLIDALSGAAGRPLKAWADAWVNRRGMPEVTTTWDCGSNGRIESLRISQRDVLGEGGVWPIKSQILLAYDTQPPVVIDMTFSGPSEPVPAAAGKPCPSYVFLNNNDLAYGRFLLDARSRLDLLDRVGKTPNPFLRSLLWGGLWDSVREVQLPPATYVRTALRDLPSEGDEELAQSILTKVTTAYRDYLTDPQREEFAQSLEGSLLDQMKNAPSLGLRITYFRAFTSVASTQPARAVLKSLLAGRDTVPGLTLKPADRWRMITALVARGDPEGERLLIEEKARDNTDDGRRFAYTAAAAQRSAGIKQRYFEDYGNSRSVPEDWVTESLGAFNSWDQSGLTFPYLKASLALLPQVKQQRKIFFLVGWLNAFLGGQHSPEALAVVDEFLKQPGLDGDLRLKVLQVRDDLERTVKIRARYGF
jgi:aminopeptidase N